MLRLVLFTGLICGLMTATSCNRPKHTEAKQASHSSTSECYTMAFGSCSHQDKTQQLWKEIIAEKPQVWIWLGDNIYGDSRDIKVLNKKYAKQKANAEYQQLIKNTHVTGTWDDHDYGENNAGKEYPLKKKSQHALLDFLDVPSDDIRRNREGVYTKETFTYSGKTIDLYLLDARYFRDKQIVKYGIHEPNLEGTILGQAQWQWLEDELKNTKADVSIFASGIQVIPEEHRFEKWANFPNDRQKLFDLLTKYDVKNPIVISGDRHIGEISKIKLANGCLYEITSSSLTHSWNSKTKEPNKHRMGNIVYNVNYGILNICPQDKQLIHCYIKTNDQVIKESTIIDCSDRGTASTSQMH